MKLKFTSFLLLGLLGIATVYSTKALPNLSARFGKDAVTQAEKQELKKQASARKIVDRSNRVTHNDMMRIATLPDLGNSPVIYGFNYNDGTWSTLSSRPNTFYAFNGCESFEMMDVTDNVFDTPISAVVMTNDKAYLFYSIYTTDEDWNSITSIIVKVYDRNTWTEIDSHDYGTVQSMDFFLRQVAAMDRSTGKIYLMTWGDGKPLMVVDPETYEYTTLPGENKGIQTIFFDKDHQLYGIEYNSKILYKIDKETGAYTEVGTLDIPFGLYPDAMSATCDYATGTIYWVAVDGSSKESYLYTIDTEDATTTLVSRMPDNEHLLGLYINMASDDAPAYPSNVRYDYTSDKLSFTAPATTYGGENLSGTLTAYTTVDNGETTSQSINAGEEVTLDLNLSEGKHLIKLEIGNNAGKSPERIIRVYVGDDVPGAVENLQLSADDATNMVLSWEAPTTSKNGGPVDDSTINYRVTRYPDEVVVADNLTSTSFSEPIPDAHARYYYTVTSKTGAADGVTVTSNIVTAGSICNPPYHENFPTQADFDSFIVLDNNNDGHTWSYMNPGSDSLGYAYLTGNGTPDPYTGEYYGNGNDDYLITPLIQLKSGVDYEFEFNSYDQFLWDEHLTILLGRQREVAGNETTIFSQNIAGDSHYSIIFSVPEDGLYTLMLHGDSPAQSVNVKLSNMDLHIYSTYGAPDAVTDMVATAGANGALTNTLTFKASTTAYQGGNLDNITEIKVYRNDSNKPVKVFENPAIGETLTFTDGLDQLGSVTYRIVPFNDKGQGKSATITNWVGLDIPATPVVTSVTMDDNYRPVISFDPVGSKGSHDGYVVPEDVKYALYRYYPWDFSEHWHLVGEFKKGVTTLVDESYENYYGQEYVDYCVVAANSVGESEGAPVGIVLGQPYALPFSESFGSGFAWQSPWTITEYSWTITTGEGSTIKPYDNDEGYLKFAYSGEVSNEARIMGPRIDLSTAQNPELSFYMTHGTEAEPEDLILKVLLNYDDQGWEEAGEIAYNNGMSGWGRQSILLRKGTGNVQVAFQAYAVDASAPICVDAIKVDEGNAKDVCVESAKISAKRVNAGESSSIKVIVSNYGTETAENVNVVLNRDQEAYKTETISSLSAGQITTVKFDLTTGKADAGKTFMYEIELQQEGDMITDNNKSSVMSLYVKGSHLPGVENMDGQLTESGAALLSWDAPSVTSMQDATTDDFEAYESFIIDNIGDWKVYDGDGTSTVYFTGPEIPNAFSPKAWQVWAPEEAGFSTEKFDMLMPHSGDKYLTCWAASDGVSTTLPNDDWLISPEIVGGSDVSFWYRMPNTGSDPQKFEILYSTTDQEPESFEVLDSDAIEFGTNWVYFEYTLPEDAKYFAIRSCSSGAYTVALLDDITFTPLYGSSTELTLEGYNVYRDDLLIASKVTETSYIDAVDGVHVYNVTVSWAQGESNYSEPITLSTSGISAALAGVKVTASDDTITVRGAADMTVSVYNTQGVCVFHTDHARTAEKIAVDKGVYLVKTGEKIVKINVR
ncbi:MAG: choice-of-anchor J domain-containing protein [Bacteroidales bacterium]|nr:choice-of-anchor J domain-containing protein [Bacteroidales bacterium]